MTHRADIDGLRAVAIVPVLLFHAGLPKFSGGFTGVDVFFVISGYLLSQVTEKYKLHLVYPHRLLCDNDWCPTAREGRVLYVDSNHLSVQGANCLAPALAPLLKPRVEPSNTHPRSRAALSQ